MGQDGEVVCAGKMERKPVTAMGMDGGNGAELPLKVYFTQSLLLFQVSPLQHWDESRTEMLTSILTTSSPFGLNS